MTDCSQLAITYTTTLLNTKLMPFTHKTCFFHRGLVSHEGCHCHKIQPMQKTCYANLSVRRPSNARLFTQPYVFRGKWTIYDISYDHPRIKDHMKAGCHRWEIVG